MTKAATLVVERDFPQTGLWLCADDGKSVVPIARFVSDAAAEQFTSLFAVAKSVAYAQGQSGI